MKPQLTLQTPLELPYQEISNYLNKLWISEDTDNSGANTFTLIIWQPAWLEQCLVQAGLINGPITGNLSPEIIELAKNFIFHFVFVAILCNNKSSSPEFMCEISL